MTWHLDAMTGYARRGLLSPTHKVEERRGDMVVWVDKPRTDAARVKSAGVYVAIHKLKPWEIE